MADRTPLSRRPVPPRLSEILTAPAPVRLRSKFLLFALSDRLVRHRVTRGLGHLAGDIGWRLREPLRRWSVALTCDPGLTQPPAPTTARPCWTYRGALRLATRWNRRNRSSGTFEVYGPAGKGDE